MPRFNTELEETPNQWPDRRGHIPRAIVLHVTEGSYESARDWTKRTEAAASYHYIIKPDGTQVEFVRPDAAAWANGLVVDSKWPGIIPRENPNLYTLSVAYAGTAAAGPTLKQFLSMAYLVAALAQEYQIPIDENTVIPHNAIRADKQCPGRLLDIAALRYLSTLSLRK